MPCTKRLAKSKQAASGLSTAETETEVSSSSDDESLPLPPILIDADCVNRIFEFLEYAAVVRCAAVCSTWRSAVRAKLQEWSLVETEYGHAVRGTSGKAPGQFRCPGALAPLPGGGLALVDLHNNRIQCLSSCVTRAAASGAIRPIDVKSTFKALKDRSQPFRGPTSAVADGSGGLLVADSQSHSLFRLSSTGTVLATFGRHGSKADELCEPEGMALDEDGKLYIADSGNHRISVVSTRRGCPGSLSPITWFGGMGVGDGLLSMPYGVAVAKQEDGGLVYVADTGSNRLCVFTRSGNFVKSLGSSSGRSRLPGRMRCPRSLIAVHGHLIVVEESRLQVLALPNGEVRQVIEFGAGPDGIAPASSGSGARVFPSAQVLEEEEDRASLWGVAADSERVYVSDHQRNRLHVFRLKKKVV